MDAAEEFAALAAQYAGATRAYAESVQRIRDSAMSLEFDAYLWLREECERSRRECQRLSASLNAALLSNEFTRRTV
jgi:hypothetical protein